MCLLCLFGLYDGICAQIESLKISGEILVTVPHGLPNQELELIPLPYSITVTKGHTDMVTESVTTSVRTTTSERTTPSEFNVASVLRPAPNLLTSILG